MLAVVLTAGIYSFAQARLTAANPTAANPTTTSAAPSAATTAEAGASPSASLNPAVPAVPASSAVDAALDARIKAILDANSQFQIGVALVDLAQDPGAADVHEYGVREEFVAASTAKVLAAAAYYHLVETGGPASMTL
ncbi:hypothetical protein [Microbacterium sp. Bi128]|uniref:hypothetical protein n=1 Tax=Microbacterium sp. Bi128 TaxID=2821115 RepID=UPI001E58EDD3|nr:hypothetical protein [Microbacterium sp. Bi128]